MYSTMKKGKNLATLVLALEIAGIVILHAIKINQTERPPTGKEISRNSTTIQAYTRVKSAYTLSSFK